MNLVWLFAGVLAWAVGAWCAWAIVYIGTRGDREEVAEGEVRTPGEAVGAAEFGFPVVPDPAPATSTLGRHTGASRR